MEMVQLAKRNGNEKALFSFKSFCRLNLIFAEFNLVCQKSDCLTRSKHTDIDVVRKTTNFQKKKKETKQ